MSSGYLSNVFLGIALVAVVFVALLYLKLSAESLKDGAKGGEDGEETGINEVSQGVAQ